MKPKKSFYLSIWVIVSVAIFLNVIAFIHAYRFTHYSCDDTIKTRDAQHLTISEKVKMIFCGINNPKPINTSVPAEPFEIIEIQSNKKLECWYINAENSKGTVILFHGYCSAKSSLLEKSNEFLHLGYNTLLVDFMGSGGSEGNQTTIGFKEAEDVKACYDYLIKKGEKKIFLFGTSMGSVAILKAIREYDFQPAAIIIECPFGSMYQTTCARFNILGVPSFPMAGLLDFWGGVQNDFWAFSFKPTEYAKSVRCPVLLLYGEQDEKVSREEIDEIFSNFICDKQLKTYPLAGHKNYFTQYKQQWIEDVNEFLKRTEKLSNR